MRLIFLPLILLHFCASLQAEDHPKDLAQTSILASAGAEKPLGTFEPKLDHKLSLAGSRLETLNFVLKLRGNGCNRISFSALSSKDSPPRWFTLRFYEMLTITSRQPSFPGAFVGKLYDPLLPVQNEKICIDQASGKWIWGELDIPAQTPPGEYRGTINFGKSLLPLELTVWKMTIPDKPALPSYTEMSTWYNLKGHFGEWRPQEAELAQKYIAELRKHRIIDITTLITWPPVIKTGERFRLDIKNSPTPDQSFTSINLQQRPAWAYFGFPTVPPADISKKKTDEYLQAVEGTLPEINRPGKAIIYLWDEPKEEDLPRLIEYCKKVRRLAPSLKIMVTIHYLPELAGLVDIFVPVMDLFDAEDSPRSEQYRQLQKNGREVWWYVSCMSHGCEALQDSGRPDFVIDRPSVYIRSIAWLAHKYGINGFLYYFVNYAYQFYPERDPWQSLWDFSGHGDGTLFYPGRASERGLKTEMPLPSIRLKLWRETSYDAEYLKWIDSVTPRPTWWPAEFASLVQNTQKWSRDYTRYHSLRQRIGQYLNQVSE
ncbi:MAG: DUF4091 domain-containing protein [Deltaproteobacteria bacterium]|nr:DUF4091 domain-containing protein [Deltaproteobacteria bacterium]